MKGIKYVSIFIIISFWYTAVAWADAYPRELLLSIANWDPYEYIEGDQAKGVNVEIVEAIAKTLGITIKWEAYPWARCVYMAKRGDVDGLMSLYRSTEREKFLYYPDEHVNMDECVFVTYKGSNVTFDGTLQCLTQANVLVARANSYGKEFDEATNFTKVMAPNQNNVVKMIAHKRCQIGIGSRGRFENTIKENALEDKVIILDPPYMVKTYFAFTRNKGGAYQTLAQDFGAALTHFKTTKQYQRILEKYGFISQ